MAIVVLNTTGKRWATFTIPSLPDLSKGAELESDGLLTDKFAKKIIDTLEDYKKDLKKCRNDFSNYARVSTNFIDHTTKELKKYRDLITSSISKVTPKNITNFREKFKACAVKIRENCENDNVAVLTNAEYGKYITGSSAKLIKAGGILIGDFAKSLAVWTTKTETAIDNLSAGDFVSTLYTENASKRKRFVQLFRERFSIGKQKDSESVLKSAQKNIIDSSVDATSESLGKTFIDHYITVYPVEYYKFPNVTSIKEENIFGTISSVVHSSKNILEAYGKTLKTYPSELREYVNSSNNCVKQLTKTLSNCLSISKQLSKSSLSFERKEKAVADLDYSFKKVQKTILEAIDSSGPIKNMLGAQNAALASPSQAAGGYLTGVYENNLSEGKQYVIGGWTLGHFLNAFNGFIESILAKTFESDAKATNSKDADKIRDKAKKLYIKALEDASNCYIATCRAWDKAENIYKIMNACDAQIKNEENFDTGYEESFSKLKGNASKKKEEKTDTSNSKQGQVAESTPATGFEKFKEMWVGFATFKKPVVLAPSEQSQGGADKQNSESYPVIQTNNAHVCKIKKDVVDKVFRDMDFSGFVEGILKNLKMFEHYGKKMRKSLDEFTRGYKYQADWVSKAQKKLAQKKS